MDKMEERRLTASGRVDDFGSAGSRRLLHQGRIPAVIYGKNAPVHITLDAKEFGLKLRHFSETALLSIMVGDKEYECLMKDYQDNLLKGIIQHVDFFEVTRGQMLRTSVSITLVGNPAGCREGGVLDQVMHEVTIESLPKDLPETLSADVSAMTLNSTLHLSDLVVPEGVKVLDDLSKTIASVKTVKEEVVAPVAEVAPEGTEATATTTTAAPAATPATPVPDEGKGKK
ncbi:MAG: 50S ribosomal protein L25 [Sphaerochaetaceae bacterium]